jgi:undecaprenyl-diphosphatase
VNESPTPSSAPDIHAEIPLRNQLLDALAGLDRRLFDGISGWRSPFLEATIAPIVDTGAAPRVLIAFAGAVSVFGGARGRRAAGEGLLAIGVSSAWSAITIRRRRTTGLPGEVTVAPSGASFPSAQTASASAFAGVVGHHLPSLWIPLNLIAAGIGFSRIYRGVHYPREVLAGWAIGKGIATSVLRVGDTVERRRTAAA